VVVSKPGEVRYADHLADLTRLSPANMIIVHPVDDKAIGAQPGSDGSARRNARRTHLRLGLVRVILNAI
jgi:hypothetical protein